MEGLEKFLEGRQPEVAVTVPSWASGWTLPTSSYIDVSAGPSRSPHASAGPELLSLLAQPYWLAPPGNSDRNNARLAASTEVVRASPDQKGRDLRLTSLGAPPACTSLLKTPPL